MLSIVYCCLSLSGESPVVVANQKAFYVTIIYKVAVLHEITSPLVVVYTGCIIRFTQNRHAGRVGIYLTVIQYINYIEENETIWLADDALDYGYELYALSTQGYGVRTLEQHYMTSPRNGMATTIMSWKHFSTKLFSS